MVANEQRAPLKWDTRYISEPASRQQEQHRRRRRRRHQQSQNEEIVFDIKINSNYTQIWADVWCFFHSARLSFLVFSFSSSFHSRYCWLMKTYIILRPFFHSSLACYPVQSIIGGNQRFWSCNGFISTKIHHKFLRMRLFLECILLISF